MSGTRDSNVEVMQYPPPMRVAVAAPVEAFNLLDNQACEQALEQRRALFHEQRQRFEQNIFSPIFWWLLFVSGITLIGSLLLVILLYRQQRLFQDIQTDKTTFDKQNSSYLSPIRVVSVTTQHYCDGTLGVEKTCYHVSDKQVTWVHQEMMVEYLMAIIVASILFLSTLRLPSLVTREQLKTYIKQRLFREDDNSVIREIPEEDQATLEEQLIQLLPSAPGQAALIDLLNNVKSDPEQDRRVWRILDTIHTLSTGNAETQCRILRRFSGYSRRTEFIACLLRGYQASLFNENSLTLLMLFDDGREIDRCYLPEVFEELLGARTEVIKVLGMAYISFLGVLTSMATLLLGRHYTVLSSQLRQAFTSICGLVADQTHDCIHRSVHRSLDLGNFTAPCQQFCQEMSNASHALSYFYSIGAIGLLIAMVMVVTFRCQRQEENAPWYHVLQHNHQYNAVCQQTLSSALTLFHRDAAPPPVAIALGEPAQAATL